MAGFARLAVASLNHWLRMLFFFTAESAESAEREKREKEMG